MTKDENAALKKGLRRKWLANGKPVNPDGPAAADYIEALEAALVEARGALLATTQYMGSSFFGPDGDRNRAQAFNGLSRKHSNALAKINSLLGEPE